MSAPRIVAPADAVVTMTPTARDRLLAGYRVRPEAVSIISWNRAAPASSTVEVPSIMTPALKSMSRDIRLKRLLEVAIFSDGVGLQP